MTRDVPPNRAAPKNAHLQHIALSCKPFEKCLALIPSFNSKIRIPTRHHDVQKISRRGTTGQILKNDGSSRSAYSCFSLTRRHRLFALPFDKTPERIRPCGGMPY